MKLTVPLLIAASSAAGMMLAFAAFGRLTLTLALTSALPALLGALAMLGLSRIRSRVRECGR